MMDYVFQFVLEPDNKGRFGLVFSEDSYVYNSPIFALPNRSEKLYRGKFKFPGEIHGEYKEFSLESDSYSLKLYIEELKQEIFFEYSRFNSDEHYYYSVRTTIEPIYPFYKMRYIGRPSNYVSPNEPFIVIMPRDVLLLDQLYLEHKFCLVGLTPTFNNERE